LQVQSERYPLLSGKGAFRPNLVYTKANMSSIVAYAGLRGKENAYLLRCHFMLNMINLPRQARDKHRKS
jgi:hypothetical protein